MPNIVTSWLGKRGSPARVTQKPPEIFKRFSAQPAGPTRVTLGVVVRAPGDADEQNWVLGLRQGDAAAFDAVFAGYRRRLYSYLVRMTRRRDVAEDLLQETFLRLAQHARKLAPDTRLGAWLFTVAHRWS